MIGGLRQQLVRVHAELEETRHKTVLNKVIHFLSISSYFQKKVTPELQTETDAKTDDEINALNMEVSVSREQIASLNAAMDENRRTVAEMEQVRVFVFIECAYVSFGFKWMGEKNDLRFCLVFAKSRRLPSC